MYTYIHTLNTYIYTFKLCMESGRHGGKQATLKPERQTLVYMKLFFVLEEIETGTVIAI